MERKELAQMHNIISYSRAAASLTNAQKVGQLFMPAAFVNDTEEEIQQLEALIQNHHIGGLCFFHSRASAATNYEGKKDVVYNERSFDTLRALITRYQSLSKYPLLISIDAEWGLAMRIENTPQYPYAICLGAIQENSDLLFQMGLNIANDCRAAGIHWNLSPVADINNNPDNPVIGYRSFGENKDLVTRKAIALMQGLQQGGLLTSAKHFPGHGDTATDSHLGLPLIDKSKDELVKNELIPFRKLIKEGVDSVMVGHLSVPALSDGSTISSSISKKILQEVLREELGFDGVIISDALNMHAVSKEHPTKGILEWLAFDAGNDVLCFAENTAEGIQTILRKAATEQIEKHFYRVWRLKEKAFSQTAPVIKELINPKPLNQKLALESLTQHLGTTLDIESFRTTEFTLVEISNNENNPFIDCLQKELNFTSYATAKVALHKIEEEIAQSKNVLLALFPPKVKPANNFDISDDELNFINQLIKQNKVVLYLFGNPYVLNLIATKETLATVIVYQNLIEFQENAARHFLGRVAAKGVLPISLNQNMS